MAERRDPARAAAALVALARTLDGGDPVADEPASIFVPWSADEPEEATPEGSATS